MYFGDNSFRPAVPVGVDGAHGLPVLQQHIVHAPGVDGEADDAGKRGFCHRNACFHMGEQGVHIPDKMAVLLLYAVGKTVDLFRFDVPILHPARNVPPGGGTDVDSKKVFHILSSR